MQGMGGGSMASHKVCKEELSLRQKQVDVRVSSACSSGARVAVVHQGGTHEGLLPQHCGAWCNAMCFIHGLYSWMNACCC